MCFWKSPTSFALPVPMLGQVSKNGRFACDVLMFWAPGKTCCLPSVNNFRWKTTAPFWGLFWDPIMENSCQCGGHLGTLVVFRPKIYSVGRQWPQMGTHFRAMLVPIAAILVLFGGQLRTESMEVHQNSIEIRSTSMGNPLIFTERCSQYATIGLFTCSQMLRSAVLS